MAGSSESGEDMESGRTNRANERTRFWAERAPGKEFEGPAILIAEVSFEPKNPDEWEGGDHTPSTPLIGIMGFGWSSNVRVEANIGGTGVVGIGGNNEGTGVFGQGGGIQQAGGGVGVHGVGGSVGKPTFTPDAPPGAGVLGQGGFVGTNSERRPYGAGVVGISGGQGKPVPHLAETGGVGVYGQGSDAPIRTINLNEEETEVGPPHPGSGLLGRGGVQEPQGREPVGAGVVGLAGRTGIPTFFETGNTGVYGRGPVGVHGHGDFGAGVWGDSEGGRGGIFASSKQAQMRLVPSDGVKTPAEMSDLAQAGDFLVTMQRNERTRRPQAVLWFCKEGGRPEDATWVQIA